jgi:hypothetical protein
MLRCSAAKQEEEEEGDGSCRCLLLCDFLRCTKKKKKKVTATLPSFAPLRYSVAKQALQCSVAFFAMLRCSVVYLVELRCKAAPQTNKQNKREKKK